MPDRDELGEYERAWQRCPRCRRQFAVLADEAGMHDCPWCGLTPDDEEYDEDEEARHA